MAEGCEMCEKKVRLALASLVRKGFVSVEKRKGKSDRYRLSQYENPGTTYRGGTQTPVCGAGVKDAPRYDIPDTPVCGADEGYPLKDLKEKEGCPQGPTEREGPESYERPDLKQVLARCALLGYPADRGREFFSARESLGWRHAATPIENWWASLDYWMRHPGHGSQKPSSASQITHYSERQEPKVDTDYWWGPFPPGSDEIAKLAIEDGLQVCHLFDEAAWFKTRGTTAPRRNS